ncbi:MULTISPECIES: hypothetical protein [Dickeya]|uniref:Uncharacterized protein n=1 Tax=Dickeya aquatica TaxID=1401087 RepID=A0A375AAW2_9GAMM|nr:MULTISPECIES: hypothetical protein [Dickeya]SLM63252.1 Domain of unknown function DUF1813 HSP20-like protein [Dickeya aquatica]
MLPPDAAADLRPRHQLYSPTTAAGTARFIPVNVTRRRFSIERIDPTAAANWIRHYPGGLKFAE